MNLAATTYPLSPTQRGILAESSIACVPELYIEQLVCTIEGAIDHEALDRAWRYVVDQSPMLRAAIKHDESGTPVLHIDAGCRVLVRRAAFDAGPESSAFIALCRADRRHAFVITEAPLHRLTIVELAAGRTALVWTYHHVILDGASRVRAVELLVNAYNQLRAGRSVPDLSNSTSEPQPFTSWCSAQDVDAAKRYWRAYLEKIDSPGAVPDVGRMPNAIDEVTGHAAATVELTPETTKELRQVARRISVTPNTVIEAVWAAILARTSRRHSVIFGRTVGLADRMESGREPGLGMRVNIVPVHADVRPESSVAQLAASIQARRAATIDYEHLGLSAVQECAPERGTKLIHSVIVQEFDPHRTLESMADVVSVRADRALSFTAFAVTILARLGEVLTISVVVQEPWGDEHLARNIAHWIEQGILAVASDPGIAAVTLPHTTTRASSPRRGRDHAATVWSAFAAQAALTPAAVAIVTAAETLTYDDLRQRAVRIANGLSRVGVGRETRVGVLMERTATMIAVLLGIMHSGGAYVPLERRNSALRTQQCLETADVKLVVVDEPVAGDNLLGSVPSISCAALLTREAQRLPEPDADNVAYVLFTSGSTGRPKGVALTHRSAAAFLDWVSATYTSAELARVLGTSSTSFDMSIFEIFGPLTAGGSVVLLPDPFAVAESIASGATLLCGVPSVLGELVRSGRIPESVRCINAGGEVLPRRLVEDLYTKCGVNRLFNVYGPTEDTTFSTTAVVGPSDEAPPIGQPIDGTEVYVLDHCLQPVPTGVVGELYLSGLGLARGYVGQAALTAERFLPDPFASLPGTRMYRTGDLARQRRNGALEYVGRVDRQVKIRGHRIELSEVEHALRNCDGVARARAGTTVNASSGALDLIAAVEPTGDVSLTDVDLRAQLVGMLPTYMIPTDITVVDHLPRTVTGKTRLEGATRPMPAMRTPSPDGNELEETLQSLWSRVLGKTVPLDTTFFDAGADSLKLFRFLSELQASVCRDLVITDLYRYPSIRAIAGYLRER